MELIIAELSRYIIVILFALYTFYSYRAFIGRAAGNNEGVFRAQRVLIVMLHLVCSAVILVEEKEIKYVVLWALELFFFLFFTKIYQVFYKGMSKLIWNNMMICMMIGFIMLGRLSYDYAIRQLVMASLALGVCLLVPLFIERFTIWEKSVGSMRLPVSCFYFWCLLLVWKNTAQETGFRLVDLNCSRLNL